jgi:hypothetical protein
MWAFAPHYGYGFGIDALAFLVWPGHMLGLTMRAVELVDNDADRPMMLGWTNLAQGAGACLSPLIAAAVVGFLSVPIVLIASFVLRLAASLVMSGTAFGLSRKAEVAPA